MRSLGPSRAHDPAPSIWSYRIQRLWLTPLFRAVVRVGLPAFTGIFLIGLYLGDTSNWRAVTDQIAEWRREIENRPEFRVTLMDVQGASPELVEEIRAHLMLDLPQSSFDLDLEAIRMRIEELPAVAGAGLRLGTGGTLEVSVLERIPAVIWQDRTGGVLLDDTGAHVAPLAARPLHRPLPIIAGDGADLAVPEALALIEAAAPLGARLRGLVRMGERRWDVVLTDGRRILLPAHAPLVALDRVLALDDAQDMLQRGILRVDMRNPARPSLQLSPHALSELRRVRGVTMPDGSG